MLSAKSTIIIPSLDPDQALLQYIQSLIDNGFQHILVVNDGSREAYDDIFSEIQNIAECNVLQYKFNRGKGRAIKNAIEYYLANIRDSVGIITVDADGQHSVRDVLRLDEAMHSSDGESVILGIRDFSGKNIPFKSKFGNKITSRIIQFFHGHYFSDTQTGLRAFPNLFLNDLTSCVAGERYEYEMNVLLYCTHRGIKIEEIAIQAIYHDSDNSCSHFRPLQDSLRVYSIILKSFFYYSLSGILSSIIDLAIFALIIKLFLGKSSAANILAATAIARGVSSIFNYFMNKNIAFKSNGNTTYSVVKYYSLCVVQLSVSAGLVYLFHSILQIDEVVVKAIIDCILFYVSYQIQKRWVFSPIQKGI